MRTNVFFAYCGLGSLLGSFLFRVYVGYLLWSQEGYPWTFMFGGHNTSNGGMIFVGAPYTWILGAVAIGFFVLSHFTGGIPGVH